MSIRRNKASRAKGQGMNWCRKEKRLAIYLRDGMACVYCGKGVEDVKLTLDHVKQHSRGGSNSERNLITACSVCNSSRGAKVLEEWLVLHGLDVDGIMAHVRSVTRRKIDKTQAKEILAARSTFVEACAAAAK